MEPAGAVHGTKRKWERDSESELKIARVTEEGAWANVIPSANARLD